MKPTIKAKIISVGIETRSITTKNTTRKVVMSVVEHADNPFGHTPKDVNPFDVEVYNHNIEQFSIGPNLVGEIGEMELMMTATGPNQFRCIVNDLSFRL
jgi:hypothetical protein